MEIGFYTVIKREGTSTYLLNASNEKRKSLFYVGYEVRLGVFDACCSSLQIQEEHDEGKDANCGAVSAYVLRFKLHSVVIVSFQRNKRSKFSP